MKKYLFLFSLAIVLGSCITLKSFKKNYKFYRHDLTSVEVNNIPGNNVFTINVRDTIYRKNFDDTFLYSNFIDKSGNKYNRNSIKNKYNITNYIDSGNIISGPPCYYAVTNNGLLKIAGHYSPKLGLKWHGEIEQTNTREASNLNSGITNVEFDVHGFHSAKGKKNYSTIIEDFFVFNNVRHDITRETTEPKKYYLSYRDLSAMKLPGRGNSSEYFFISSDRNTAFSYTTSYSPKDKTRNIDDVFNFLNHTYVDTIFLNTRYLLKSKLPMNLDGNIKPVFSFSINHESYDYYDLLAIFHSEAWKISKKIQVNCYDFNTHILLDKPGILIMYSGFNWVNNYVSGQQDFGNNGNRYYPAVLFREFLDDLLHNKQNFYTSGSQFNFPVFFQPVISNNSFFNIPVNGNTLQGVVKIQITCPGYNYFEQTIDLSKVILTNGKIDIYLTDVGSKIRIQNDNNSNSIVIN